MFEIAEDGNFVQQLPNSSMPEGAELLLLEPPSSLRNPSQTDFTLTWMVGSYRHYMTLTPEVNALIRRAGIEEGTGLWGMGTNRQAWFLMDPNNNTNLSSAESDILRLDSRDLLAQRISVTDTQTGNLAFPISIERERENNERRR